MAFQRLTRNRRWNKGDRLSADAFQNLQRQVDELTKLVSKRNVGPVFTGQGAKFNITWFVLDEAEPFGIYPITGREPVNNVWQGRKFPVDPETPLEQLMPWIPHTQGLLRLDNVNLYVPESFRIQGQVFLPAYKGTMPLRTYPLTPDIYKGWIVPIFVQPALIIA